MNSYWKNSVVMVGLTLSIVMPTVATDVAVKNITEQRFNSWVEGTVIVLAVGMLYYAWSHGYLKGNVVKSADVTKNKATDQAAKDISDHPTESVTLVVNDSPIVNMIDEKALEEALTTSIVKKPLMHINDIYRLALPQAQDGGQAFNAQLQRLAEYCGRGDLSKSQYLCDIQAECNKAMAYFADKKPMPGADTVVFDYDGTLMTTFNRHYYKFLNKRLVHGLDSSKYTKPCCNHSDRNKSLVLDPVKQLWDFFISKGFKIVIISQSLESIRSKKMHELEAVGYKNVDIMHLQAEEKWSQVKKLLLLGRLKEVEECVGQWKYDIRSTLDVAANVGDFPSDFLGGHNGHEVRLPNPLRRIHTHHSIVAV